MGGAVSHAARTGSPTAPKKSFSDIAYDQMNYLFSHPAGDPTAVPPLPPSVGSAYVRVDPTARAGNHATDCITYVTDVLQYAFNESGDAAKATAVKTRPLNIDGTALASYLVKAGWHAYYWNPDPAFSADRKDFVEHNDAYIDNVFFSRPGDPSGHEPASMLAARRLRFDRARAYADEHTYSYGVVKSRKSYYGIKIEDSITGYRPTPRGTAGKDAFGNPFGKEPSPTVLSTRRLDAFGTQVKFAYGMTRGATHTFLFSNGFVLEVHWDKPPGDPNLFQKTPLMNWPWESGIVVVPGDTPVHLPPA